MYKFRPQNIPQPYPAVIDSVQHSGGEVRKRLVVAHVIDRCYGGVGMFVAQLSRAQLQDPQIAEVHVLADGDYSPELLGVKGITLHAYHASRQPVRFWSVAKEVQRILGEITPDVVIAHSSFPGVYVRLVPPKARAPVVYCAHGWSFSQCHKFLQHAVYSAVERFLSPWCEAIVNISEHENRAALAVGIEPSIQRTIWHGIPDAKQEIPAPLALRPGQINYCYIGRFDYKKGVDRLLAAFDNDRMSGCDLWLLSKPTEGGPFVIPDRPNIHCVGWVPNNQVDAYLRAMDALIVPSRWEGFGLSAIEAMRAGRAVIASRVGGLPEIVVEGQTGLFLDVDDLEDMRRVLRSPSREDLLEMGRRGREVYEAKFTWARCYAAWQRVVLDALAKHKPVVPGARV